MKFKDVLSKVFDYRGKTPKKLGLDWTENGDILAISAKNIKKQQLVNLDKSHRGDEGLYHVWMKDGDLQPGDVLLTSEAPLGESYQVKHGDRFIVSQRVFGLRPNTNLVDVDYFAAYLSSNLFRKLLDSKATGTTVLGIKQSELLNLDIELPDINTQKKIGTLIRSLNAKIEITQLINDNLLELASALFEGSFPNVRGGETAIGTLMSNFDKQRKPLSKNQRAQRQGEYRYIGATSVVDHVDDFTFDGIYLLLGEDGTVQTDDGKPVLQYVWGPFWPNNHTHVLQGKGVSTEWLYLFWKNQNITSIITGAVQPKISQGNMNSIKVTKPSDVELATFQQKIDPIFNMIRLNADEIENLKVIRDQLLKELLG
ncbi:restriction endonuclease subunit S [Weissella paramesenteroides]